MTDADFIRLALRLARRGYGTTSPNPMVGAVLVKSGKIIGRGWHRRAGEPHAEIEALGDAQHHGRSPKGSTLYVTLEPCCTQGQTPPCTEAIISAGIRRVVVGAIDPNPKHRGRAFKILRRAGIQVVPLASPSSSPVLPSPSPPSGDKGTVKLPAQTPSPPSGERGRVRGRSTLRRPQRSPSHSRPRRSRQTLAAECIRLNEAFNHWIVHRTPLVTIKAAMTLDGKIATAGGQSKWITDEPARAFAMKLRQGADAVLVGVNTILADDPSLTLRSSSFNVQGSKLRRIVLDSLARTPLNARVVRDALAALTTIVVSRQAPRQRVAALAGHVNVLVAPTAKDTSRSTPHASRYTFHVSHPTPYTPRLDLPWLLRTLGNQNVTSLLVEGGGEVNASFLLGGLAHRIAFFYAPTVLGGRESRPAVAGDGVAAPGDILELRDLEWRKLGPDLLLTARLVREKLATGNPHPATSPHVYRHR